MKAMILGCSGASVSEAERQFFAAADPYGFILFERNCRDPKQLRALVTDLRDCVGRDSAPVLIDQEGGRVARLKPPHWRSHPAPSLFDRLARTHSEQATEGARLSARLIAACIR